ncbi:MAG: tetratricopeptide repeat protein [Deltaproteobacteria bacterium]|nr:tetratricopeptide repeat protein [Deltaproteobacteria bacterium]
MKNNQRRLSPLKQIIFTALIFIMFFAVLEVALSLFGVQPLILTEDPMVGFGENVPLFVKQKHNDGTFIYRTAKNKLKYFNDQSFPEVKGKNSYRIFCLGGSTTYGRPYDNRLSFCGWLDSYLKEAEPGITWEVINAGGISYASYRVAKLMQELTLYDPDLFIVYSGQNEFLERRSYSKLADLPTWLINFESTLNRTRIYSSMKRLYENLRPDSFEKAKKKYELSGEVRTMLEYTAGPASYHRDDTHKKQIITHYHSNLERMTLLAREADAKIIFVTPVINIKDVSPFKSEFKEGVSESSKDLFVNLLNNGKKLYAEGNPADALKLYKQAFEIDNRYADLFFEIGRVMFDLKNYDKAEEAFRLAVDEDIAPLRALSYMRTILFDISSKYSVPLVDFEQILKQEYLKEYGHPVFGNEYFMDHVHTDDERYRILGLSLLKELKNNEIISADRTLSNTQIDKVQKQVRSSLKNEYYRESLFNLARVFDWAGKFEETKNILKKNIELYGEQGEAYSLLGMALLKNRETEDAIVAFQKAIKLGYETPKLYMRLADAYREAGRFSDAFEAYKDKLRLDGAEYEAHMLYGLLYAFQGNNKSAIDSFTESLRLKPDFLPASINMVGSLFIEKRYDEAMVMAKEVLKQDPKQFKMYYVIGQILLGRGDTEGAIKYFSETLNLAPDFKMARESLARARQLK